jgi:hypothetical protein
MGQNQFGLEKNRKGEREMDWALGLDHSARNKINALLFYLGIDFLPKENLQHYFDWGFYL